MNKPNAILKLKEIKSGNKDVLRKIDNVYTNIIVDDEIEDFEKMFHNLQKDILKLESVKIFQDGDYFFSTPSMIL